MSNNEISSPELAIDLTDLPNSMQELSALIGLPAVISIVKLSGGNTLTIPREGTEEHRLYELVGNEAFSILTSHFSGEAIEVPICTIAWRRAEAVYYHHKGYSKREIARKLNITKRGVSKIFNVLQHQGRI